MKKIIAISDTPGKEISNELNLLIKKLRKEIKMQPLTKNEIYCIVAIGIMLFLNYFMKYHVLNF